jgi:hypothetical protein
MITNGTGGFSPGGIISVSPSELAANINGLLTVQSLAVRAIFSLTQAVGGSDGTLPVVPGTQGAAADTTPPAVLTGAVGQE